MNREHGWEGADGQQSSSDSEPLLAALHRLFG